METNTKVILILVDGMRPDAIAASGNAWAPEFLRQCLYTLKARTVMPSVTLPCHMSLFHSVTPERHGITTNHYIPMARPLDGLVERLHAEGKHCAFFYDWEELRDLSRPGNLQMSFCASELYHADADVRVTDAALKYLAEDDPDFAFVYLGQTDSDGHDHGWMGPEYLARVDAAFNLIRRIREGVPADTAILITADHGGHDRDHGHDIPEDMTIPLILSGPMFTPGSLAEGARIIDIAPTIAKLLGVQPAREWEGKPLV